MEQIKYGGEDLGYNTLARDMTPQKARNYLNGNMRDGLIEKMDQDRLKAIRRRAEEDVEDISK